MKKGQITIGTILITIITIILYVSLLPTLNTIINNTLPSIEGDVMTTSILLLIPFLMLIGIIIGFFSYNERRYQ